MDAALALAVPVGLLVGITMGALGGGGSILAVPALVYLLGQGARAATTGSLIVVGSAAVIAAWLHARAGYARIGQGAVFGLLGVAGAWLGSRLAVGVADPVLLSAFAALLLLVAVMMTLRRGRQATGPPDPAADGEPHRIAGPGRVALLVLTASLVGLLTGFFGVGGGFVIVPALVLVVGLSMRTAIGTSLVVIAVNSASALVSRLGAEVSLDWATIGVFAAAAIGGSLLGARVAARVPPARLSAAFTGLVVVVAVYMAVRSVPRLL